VLVGEDDLTLVVEDDEELGDSVEVVSAAQRVRPLSLPAVRLLPPKFVSATASARLEWTQYSGPRFGAYVVERRVEGTQWQEVQRIPNATVTRYGDEGLLANTEYSYRVTVATTQSEALPSHEAVGRIHGRVGNWPLDLEDDAYVRLYCEGGDGLTVLVVTRTGVRLLSVDDDGEVLGEQTLVDAPYADIEPRSVTTAVMGGTRRMLSLRSENSATIIEFGLEGEAISREYPLFADEFSDPLGEVAQTGGMIALTARKGSSKGVTATGFDNIEVWVEGEKVFDEGFDAGAGESWNYQGMDLEDGWGHGSGGDYGRVYFDDVWQNVRLEMDILARGGIAQIALGTRYVGNRLLRPSSTLRLMLSDASTATLHWFGLPAEGHSQSLSLTQILTFPLFRGLAYHLGHGAGGRLRVVQPGYRGRCSGGRCREAAPHYHGGRWG